MSFIKLFYLSKTANDTIYNSEQFYWWTLREKIKLLPQSWTSNQKERHCLRYLVKFHVFLLIDLSETQFTLFSIQSDTFLVFKSILFWFFFWYYIIPCLRKLCNYSQITGATAYLEHFSYYLCDILTSLCM